MTSVFDRVLIIADKTNYRINGELATFAYNNLADTAQISVIFEKSKDAITMQGEQEVVTRRPVATVQHQALFDKNLPLPKVRDQLTVQGVVYDILAIPDDGHNETEMWLEKA